MRLFENQMKTRRSPKAPKGEQLFSLTSKEIMADLMYPAVQPSPKARKGHR